MFTYPLLTKQKCKRPSCIKMAFAYVMQVQLLFTGSLSMISQELSQAIISKRVF